MAASQQVRWEEVQPILGAQPTQQVPFAQYVVNIGAVQGGVLNFGAPGRRAEDLIRPRPQPPQILPRRVSGFVDRDQEQRVVGQSLARDQVVDVHGPDGMGKTALITQTMYTQLPGAFPDGMIYLSGRHQSRDDLLQGLFECFYDTSTGGHVKVGENDVRRYLAGKRALIVVDDCNELDEGDADALSQAAPQSALLIAGREPQAWGGESVALHGLPRSHAIALLERMWGQPLGADAATADAICAALGDMPLAIAKAARTAAGRQVPLGQLLQELQPRTAGAAPTGQAFFMLGQHLSEGERTVLSSVAAPNGDSVDRQAVVAISGLAAADVDRYLARLVKLELVRAERDRYRLDEALRPYVRHYGADEAMRARAADYYRRLAGSLHAHSPDPDEENVIAALRYYYEQRDWPAVIEIVRALEPYLATTGRWGQWRRRLRDAGYAAQQIGDRATEAWVQNQLGIVALGAADAVAARQFFEAALRTWRALGDRQGATIARWNLHVLLGPPPSTPRRAEPRPSPEGGVNPVLVALGGVAAALLVGLGVLAVILFNDGGTVTPLPPVTTVVPPTTEVPPPPVEPWIDLTLIQGCDQTYAPGDALDIRVQSNVAGVVDVFRHGPGGGQERQFSQEVGPSQLATARWTAPRREGRWVLEAILDNGRATDECAFTVEVPIEPSVRIWLAGAGCETMYEPGTPEEVGYQANVDGDVAAYLIDPDGRSSLLFSDRVAAGQSESRSWRLPDREGQWTLRAELNDDQARSDCRFSVLLPPSPPVFGDQWAEWADPYETCPGDPINLYVSVFDDQPLARVELRTRPPGGAWTSSSMQAVDDTTYVGQAVAYESPGLEYVFYAEDERGSGSETESDYLTAQPCFSIVYDFVASAAAADWYAGVPYSGYEPYYDTYSLGFPGSETDSSGFALWRDRPTLEDGSQAPGQVLVTYPPLDEDSQIFGDYYLSNEPIYIQSGDAFVAQVGLLQGAGSGDVTFELYFAPIYVEGAASQPAMTASASSQPQIIFLGRVYEAYDGELTDWRIPLDSIAGETGLFRLLVLAGDSASDDWATWVVARIERYGD